MDSGAEYQSTRTVAHSVVTLLTDQGYTVVRISHRRSNFPVPFHLIAWNDITDQICIKVGSFRIQRKKHALQEELTRLCRLVRLKRIPGELQYWVRGRDCWTRYRILAGGAVMIQGDGCDIR